MTIEAPGKTVLGRARLTHLEKKVKVVDGEIMEINGLGLVFRRDDYRKRGNRMELILSEDIVAIAELLPKLSQGKQASASKPKTTTPKPKPAVEPERVVVQEESSVENEFVDEDEFEDDDDLDFDND